jgi:hypothetical protein
VQPDSCVQLQVMQSSCVGSQLLSP